MVCEIAEGDGATRSDAEGGIAAAAILNREGRRNHRRVARGHVQIRADNSTIVVRRGFDGVVEGGKHGERDRVRSTAAGSRGRNRNLVCAGCEQIGGGNRQVDLGATEDADAAIGQGISIPQNLRAVYEACAGHDDERVGGASRRVGDRQRSDGGSGGGSGPGEGGSCEVACAVGVDIEVAILGALHAGSVGNGEGATRADTQTGWTVVGLREISIGIDRGDAENAGTGVRERQGLGGTGLAN